eukprot:TRINITY_DN471_c0_g4_i1.p1 TRINITY_DN471_c0_g4~~TRINITY_DN471_c0_g4_i1.p1  ORF type:complete len:447 (+),score=81.25 TRINITY_DN471_c0_g4_i1:61-1401(+)
MDDEYDCIVLGTGLTECILSGLLSVEGQKVLHMDRNDYYGGECASLNLEQLYSHFGEKEKPPESLGKPRSYNVDLVPKFLMADGTLVKILLFTDVTRYLEFKSVEGSYVYRKEKKDGKIYKVPASTSEVVSSSLMGMFEKKRFKDFLTFVLEFDEKDPKTWKGIEPKKTTTAELLSKYKFDDSTKDFLGHALALYHDESWSGTFATETIARVKLYGESLAHYGKSPYLYPLYGLGDLPQAFARLSAIYGGTYMLNKPIEEIVYDSNGQVCGVKSEGKIAKTKNVIGDPSYFPSKVKKVGQIVRCICILSHPIQGSNDAASCQIIIPQNQVGRKHDIYISCVSFAHNVAPKGKYIVLVSTQVEGKDPKSELQAGINLLGNIDKSFYSIHDLYEPANDAAKERVFISKSYDASSHFASIAQDVVRIYKQYTGRDLDLTKPKKKVEEQE